MQWKFYITCILLIICHNLGCIDAQDIKRGILETHIYRTSVKGPKLKKLKVYLPANYYNNHESYPVIYLLHGANGNEQSWVEKGEVLKDIDSLVKHNIIDDYIYVFPNTNRYYHEYDYIMSRPKGSIESYLDLNGSTEYSFIEDIITYIDNNFRTIPLKQYRAIAGLSLGGLQSLYISANSERTFGHVGLFSPLIYPPPTLGIHSYIYRDIERKLKKQFADETLNYMIMIGKDDPYYRSVHQYCEFLKQQGYNIQFIPTYGGHSWDNWKNYSIIFLKSFKNRLSEKTQ